MEDEGKQTESLEFLCFIILSLLLANIIIKFTTSIEDKGIVQSEPKIIIKTYLKSNFFVDAFGIIALICYWISFQ